MTGHKVLIIMKKYSVSNLESVQMALTSLCSIPDDGAKVYTAKVELRLVKKHLKGCLPSAPM